MKFDQSSATFALWTRGALDVTLVAVTVVLGWVVLSLGDATGYFSAAALAVLGGCGVAAIETDPRLSLQARPAVLPWKDITALLGVALMAGGFWLGSTREHHLFALAAASIVALAGIHGRRWDSWWALALTAACVAFFASIDQVWMGFVPPLCYLSTLYSLWYMDSLRAAEHARQLEAQVRVQDERLRFAQQLHDTLGQHLAAMSLKAELAKALVARGDECALSTLDELHELTKVSMGQLREVVEGYRTVNLSTELAGARALLESAGIGVRVHGNALDLPEPQRELAAWFVREGATNILKHAHATRATFRITASSVSVANDGVSETPGALGGLSALRRQAEQADAHLSIEHRAPMFTATIAWKAPAQKSKETEKEDA